VVVARRMNLAFAAGLVVFIAGIARDLQWHATHDTQKEFETASKQVEVHWLLWLGALTILIVSAEALRRSTSGHSRNIRVAFGSAVVYACVSVWHFIEHANGNDPQVAHLFLYAAAIGIIAGTVLALVPGRAGVTARPG
jgi:predicted membrane channel-forming protein YqfA (hemolysin III family)